MWRKTIKLSVAQAAMCCGGLSAYAQDAEGAAAIVPLRGDIHAFTALTEPGSGIDPFRDRSMGGDINPFAGDVYPFYGNISPFWGDIAPFWGQAFGGDINPFWGASLGGDISPFWGDIDPLAGGDPTAHTDGLAGYWHEAGPLIGELYAEWAGAETPEDFESLGTSFGRFLDFSASSWGAAVEAATGLGFREGFAAPLLAEYGLDAEVPSSFGSLTDAQRSAFFLDWYDGLMAHSGMDIPDHWMPMVGWSPAITQDQGFGTDAKVGLLDMRIAAGDQNVSYLIDLGGYAGETDPHGSAVASLIAARHDGSGVMGIAPRATVFAYNPSAPTAPPTPMRFMRGSAPSPKRARESSTCPLGYPDRPTARPWSIS